MTAAAAEGVKGLKAMGDPAPQGDAGAVSAALMPDGLHPNGEGALAMARCLRPFLETVMPRAADKGGDGTHAAAEQPSK